MPATQKSIDAFLTRPPAPSPLAGMEAVLDSQRELLALVWSCANAPPAQRPTFGAVGRRLRAIQKAAAKSGLVATPRRCGAAASAASSTPTCLSARLPAVRAG